MELSIPDQSVSCYASMLHSANKREWNSEKYPLVLLLHGGGERAKVNNTPIQNRDVLLNQAYVKVWSSPKVQELWPSFIVVPLSREIWRMMKTFSSCQLREKHTLKVRQCWHEKILISFQSAFHQVLLD